MWKRVFFACQKITGQKSVEKSMLFFEGLPRKYGMTSLSEIILFSLECQILYLDKSFSNHWSFADVADEALIMPSQGFKGDKLGASQTSLACKYFLFTDCLCLFILFNATRYRNTTLILRLSCKMLFCTDTDT